MTVQFKDPSAVIDARFGVLYDFDVTKSNPNGDPDMDNAPRVDPYDGRGMVSPHSLKRKVRDFVHMTMGETAGYGIHVARRAVLNRAMEEVCREDGLRIIEVDDGKESEDDGEEGSPAPKKKGRKDKKKVPKLHADDAGKLSDGMARRYFDVRAFGGVLSVGVGGLNVTGPVQFSWAESVHPVTIIVPTITRTAVTNEERSEKSGGRNQDMGSAPFVRYGLYRCEISVSPFEARKTGFTYGDFELLLRALRMMHQGSQSSGRRINTRRITVFQHEPGDIGSALDCEVFPASRYALKEGVEEPSSYGDYEYALDLQALPRGVTAWEYVGQDLHPKAKVA